MTTFPVSDLNRVKRIPKRGAYDADIIYPILDAGFVCHVAFNETDADGKVQLFVIPTLYARADETILLHGATTSRMIQHAAAGNRLCITVTHIDGIVMARSVFHHSINYRSAVVFGTGALLEDEDAKRAAMRAFTERLLPGRWDDSRPPNPVEMKATSIVAVTMESASAKVRTGDPGDDEDDIALPYWAGVLPLTVRAGDPIPAPNLHDGIAVPAYLSAYIAARNR
jgi:nitroimidazol reductase NimA-like FMN-containing flavoprotein (pyridoxamine 5'-phosphate oxidase superfamily)